MATIDHSLVRRRDLQSQLITSLHCRKTDRETGKKERPDMKMRSATALLSAIGVLATTGSPLAAQSAPVSTWPADGDVRVIASIRVPLGQDRNARNPAYSVELSLEASTRKVERVTRAQDLRTSFEDRSLRYLPLSRIAFSSGRQSDLTINGQRVATFGPTFNVEDEGQQRSGLSTTGKVLIGVGLITGLVVFTATQVSDDLADLSDVELP